MPTLEGNSLRPFFGYFGSKWLAANHYRKPEHETIIEPFAGSAGYSLSYPRHDVLLYDADPVIVGVWQYLIRSSYNDIMALPSKIEHTDEIKQCQEARWLVGLNLSPNTTAPYTKPNKWIRDGWNSTSAAWWGEKLKERIAKSVRYIKHWKAERKSYDNVPIRTGTWFVDPPYKEQGKHYKFGARLINYEDLSAWCRTLPGQVIVCEAEGANWLDFRILRQTYSTATRNGRSRGSKDVVWYNN